MRTFCFVLLSSVLSISCFASDEQERGVRFLRDNMPAYDKNVISEERLNKEVSQALNVRNEFSWARQTPWDIYENDVLPYFVVDEPRDEWRQMFHDLFAPLVQSCTNGKEATRLIASQIRDILKVSYSTERRAPNQGIKESLESGKVSCTGQSILLICALRSVGIPARMIGVLSWNHVPGNHSWTEAWCDGEWMMIEYNEKDFNTPWVMSAISMLDPERAENTIYATSCKKTSDGVFFPMIWTARIDPLRHQLVFPNESRTVPAVDVSERYRKEAQEFVKHRPEYIPGTKLMIEVRDTEGRRLPVSVTLLNNQGVPLATGTAPAENDDIRRFLEMTLPEKEVSGTLLLTYPDGKSEVKTVHHTQAPVQIIRWNKNAQ